MKNVILIHDKRNPKTHAEIVARILNVRATIGGNIRSWRERAGISLDQTEPRLGVPTLELLAWEFGAISPLCSRFGDCVKRLDAVAEASQLLNDLNLQSQLVRKALAESLKRREWGNTFDALGTVASVAA